MEFQIWIIFSVGIVGAMAGFWLGAGKRWATNEMNVEEQETRQESLEMKTEEVKRRDGETRGLQLRLKRNEPRKYMGTPIGSPATGMVSSYMEGDLRGACVQTNTGLLYAPASGKITKVFPMGNAFTLRTEKGTELLLQVGSNQDELLSEYYRPRVIQNEIVNKGKVLLEFDQERLARAGVNSAISLAVNQSYCGETITLTQEKQVKVGEDLLWIKNE